MATESRSSQHDGTAQQQQPSRGMGYREIAERLIRDIREGSWKAGEKLPTESQLIDRFSVSRNTIRESLRELETFGYIKRRRGTRSVLLTTDPGDGFVNSVQTIGELLQYSRYTVSRILNAERIIAGPEMAERLNAPEGSRWIRIEILRNATRVSMPIGYSEIFVDGRFEDILTDLDENKAVYNVLEEKYDLVFRRVVQTLSAASASLNVASRLNIPAKSPILTARTDFITSAGETVEIGFGHFPSDRYKVEIVLQRGSQNRFDMAR